MRESESDEKAKRWGEVTEVSEEIEERHREEGNKTWRGKREGE